MSTSPDGARGEPLVSVVVPTYNSEEHLDACLRSVRNQTLDDLEVIVVDRVSEDDTVQIARRHGARTIVLDADERSEQINRGMEVADGAYLYRVDSDFVLEETVVEEAVEACEEEGVDAVVVHNTSDPSVSFWSKVRKLERDCYRDSDRHVAARFFRREVYEALDGFDDGLVAGEDYDFHTRVDEAGFDIGRVRSQEVHLGEPASLLDIVRKHYYYGKTIDEFVRKSPRGNAAQLSPVRKEFLDNWRSFLKHPILTAGFVVYQVARYSSAGAGLTASKLGSAHPSTGEGEA